MRTAEEIEKREFYRDEMRFELEQERIAEMEDEENYCICPECGETTDEGGNCPIRCENCRKHLSLLSGVCYCCDDCNLHYRYDGDGLRCIPCSEDDLTFCGLPKEHIFAVTAAPLVVSEKKGN